jgi:hypothetical protein
MKNAERRTERRLRYQWPVWYAEDFDDTLSQGQMVDISSSGAAFTCPADDNCPYIGQEITTRFSVPLYIEDDSFDMSSFTRSGSVCRIEETNSFIRRIAMKFAEPLPFKPGEQSEAQDAQVERVGMVTI